MVAGNEDIDAYTEHMDVMLMKNEKDVEDLPYIYWTNIRRPLN